MRVSVQTSRAIRTPRAIRIMGVVEVGVVEVLVRVRAVRVRAVRVGPLASCYEPVTSRTP